MLRRDACKDVIPEIITEFEICFRANLSLRISRIMLQKATKELLPVVENYKEEAQMKDR